MCSAAFAAVGFHVKPQSLCTTTYGDACVPAIPVWLQHRLENVEIPDIDADDLGDKGTSGLQTVADFVKSVATACPDNAKPRLQNAVKLSSLVCLSIS